MLVNLNPYPDNVTNLKSQAVSWTKSNNAFSHFWGWNFCSFALDGPREEILQ